MTRILSKLVLGTALVILVSPPDIFAGRGGGYRGGGRRLPRWRRRRLPRRRRRDGGITLVQPATLSRRISRAHISQYGNTLGAQLESSRGCRRRRRGLCQPQPEPGSPRGCRRRRAGYANNNQSLAHPGAAAPPPARAMPTTTRARLTPRPRAPPPARAMPTIIPASTAPGTETTTAAGRSGLRLGLRQRGRGLGSRLADVWLGLFGL